jgi:hypothetical protein
MHPLKNTLSSPGRTTNLVITLLPSTDLALFVRHTHNKSILQSLYYNITEFVRTIRLLDYNVTKIGNTMEPY